MRCAILVWCCAVVLVAGCRKAERATAAATQTGTLLLGNGAEPADLDPQIITAYTDGNIIMALFEGLTVLDEASTKPVPAAAERWEVSEDRLTWTFHLRPTLKWSNGSPLSAQDFVSSWRRLLTPSVGAENAYYLYAVKNAEAFHKGRLRDAAEIGVAAADDHTLVVTLERPTPYFAMLTAQPCTYPVPKDVLEKFGAARARGTAWSRPGNHVGNGPFMLKEWRPNARVVVVRNPHYWGFPSVRLREIQFFPTESPDVDERSFRAGQRHATFTLPLSRVGAWQDKPELRRDPFLQTLFLRFNTTREPLLVPNVRQALSRAIDREAIAKKVLRGTGTPAYAFTPPDIGGYTARARVQHDFTTARQLLARANRDGPPLEIEIQCRNDEIQPRLAEVLQDVWQRELGVRVTIAPMEQKTWLQNQQTLQYTVAVSSWIADYPDPSNFLGLFVTGGGYNWTGWGKPEYDRIVASAERENDPARRYEVLQIAETMLLEALPITPLVYGSQTYLLDPAVRGWPPARLGTRRYHVVTLEADK